MEPCVNKRCGGWWHPQGPESCPHNPFLATSEENESSEIFLRSTNEPIAVPEAQLLDGDAQQTKRTKVYAVGVERFKSVPKSNQAENLEENSRTAGGC